MKGLNSTRLKVFNWVIFMTVITLIGCKQSKNLHGDVYVKSQNQFKELFHKANSEKMIGHNDNAIDLFKKCIEIDPKSSVCHFALSDLYLKENNLYEALNFANSSYSINPKNKWYLIHLADIYFQMGDYFNSAKYYKIVISEFEDKNLKNKERLTESLIFSNQKQKAIDLLNLIESETGKTVRSSVTKHDLLIDLNEKNLANKEIETLFEYYKNDIEIPIEVLHYFLQTHQIDEAYIAIKRIQEINPNNGHAYIGLAEIELAKDNIDNTFSLLIKGLESEDITLDRKIILLESLISLGFEKRYPKSDKINRKLPELFFIIEEEGATNQKYLQLYGQYLLKNNQFKKARIHLREATKLSADFDIWINLLDADYLSKSFENLIEDSKMALEIFPSQPLVYLLLGIGYYELGDLEKSIEILQLGSDLIIEDIALENEFIYHSAKVKWVQGETSEASNSFINLLKSDSTNHKYYFGYAKLLYNDNRIDDATINIQNAVKLDPNNPEYLHMFSQLLFEATNYKLAGDKIIKAIASDIKNSLYIELYGDIKFHLGDIDSAIELWQEANKIEPSNDLQNKIENKTYQK